MNNEPRPPTRHGPPRRGATAGDTLFALGIAGLVLLLAGAMLAAGGGMPWLARQLPGVAAGAAPRDTPSPGPSARASSGPIQPASPTPGPQATPARSPGPAEAPTPAPSSGPAVTPAPTPTAARSPEPTPPPVAAPFTMNLFRKGVFVHQVDKESCVAAAAQNMLNVMRLVEDGRAPDRSASTQRAIYRRTVELTTRRDSHNGGTGAGGWAAFLSSEGYPYELRTYATRNEAIRAAAVALRATRRPVGMLAWQGVHSWVMTGFTATADPATTASFRVSSANVIDPWYPWVSNRWPRSKAPNAAHDAADLKANYLPYKLGSGPYPGRDGRFLLVVPIAP